MNYQEQRITFWREVFHECDREVALKEAVEHADLVLAEFDKRFGPKTEPLPELTK